MRTAATALAALLLTSGCTSASEPEPAEPPASSVAGAPAPSTTPTPTPRPEPTPRPAFDAGRAIGTVRHLAGEIGPRLATGPAFREAAAWVEERFAQQGYDVRRQSFRVPAGDSWGVPVGAGRSTNLVATGADFDATAPYVVIGAHLDTVAVAPGAEDNASGIAVLLELARVLGGGQVVLVAFGGEEPRGPGDLHHFGSKAYVERLGEAGVDLRAMVALDRVGVGTVVPLSSVAGTPAALRDRLADVADELGIATATELDSASDHESFADAGFLAARIGSTPYAGYHSAQDVPSVVDRAQLGRVGRLLIGWTTAALRAS